MTDVPSFVFAILNKELREIQKKLLQNVATDYGLNQEELTARYLPDDPVKITPNSTTKVEVVRRVNAKPPPPDHERCMARVWGRGKGGQCSKKRTQDSEFCRNHSTSLLRHGRIDQTPPAHIYGHVRSVYK